MSKAGARRDKHQGEARSPRRAWWPIPLFLLAILALSHLELHGSYGSAFLLIALNFVFSALISLIITFLVSRSFLRRGSPGLLLLGCGVFLWGISTVVSVWIDPHDINTNVTIYNTSAWIAALCHLMGAVMSIRPSSIPARAVVLAASYTTVMGILAFIAYSASAGWTPLFFIQGMGGTPLRQGVLASSIGMFVLAAIVLRVSNARSMPSFTYWYTLAMLLIATGMFGTWLQSSFGGLLNWVSRAAIYTGGMYMLIAAVVSVRDSREWEVSLATALNEARQRYEDLFHLAVDGIVVQELGVRAPGRLTQVNSAMCELLGYPCGDLLAMKPEELVVPEERPAVTRHLSNFSTVGSVQFETRLLHRDGRHIPVEVNSRLFNERGAPMVMFIVRDATARKQAEQQLSELLQRLTYHVENSPLAVVEWGRDRRITRWSGGAERLFGWEAREVLGKRMEDFPWVYSEDLSRVDQVSLKLQTGETRSFSSNRNYRKDGSVVHCEWYNSSLLDDSGEIRSILSLVLDVTARTTAERDLRRVNADLEQFAYAVSHDLRESLRAVCVFSELLAKQYGDNLAPEAMEHISRIVSGSRRMVSLLSGLRTYLHTTTSKLAKEMTDSSAVAADVIALLQPAIARENGVVTCDALPGVAVEAVHLQQLFQNLIGNALKFRAERAPEVTITAVPSGTMWKFAVKDNGIGIDPRFCKQIFGVFKRLHTQDKYEGTGIGLAICQKIVERYGGSIWVESEEGRGATFFFTLPGG